MKCRTLWHAALAVIVLAILTSLPAWGQQLFQFSTQNIRLQVLSEGEFAARFGNNPEIPRSDQEILALAERLYPPPGKRPPAAAPGAPPARVRPCRNHQVGLLFAALKNPAISDLTRRQVDLLMAAVQPALPKTYRSGHFLFYYTDSDPEPLHNVTLNDVKATAKVLNAYWKKYAKSFTKPKFYLDGQAEMIFINVYHLEDAGGPYAGETSQDWNHINLSSDWAVTSACNRKNTSAHELFHRVQFSYGYSSGTADTDWLSEGTAEWAEKYVSGVWEYLSYMSLGLMTPNVNLVKRSYDACHFWVYLYERAGVKALKEIWAAYAANGHDARKAVDGVVTKRLILSFEQFTQDWHKTNFFKDLKNAPKKYDYAEDEYRKSSCGIHYGPLSSVTTDQFHVDQDAKGQRKGLLLPYGAAYYDFQLDPTLTDLRLHFQGGPGGDFSCHFIPIKNNKYLSMTDTTEPQYTFTKTLKPGQWDRVAVVVTGRATGGGYTVGFGKGNMVYFYRASLTGGWTESMGGLDQSDGELDAAAGSFVMRVVNDTLTATIMQTLISVSAHGYYTRDEGLECSYTTNWSYEEDPANQAKNKWTLHAIRKAGGYSCTTFLTFYVIESTIFCSSPGCDYPGCSDWTLSTSYLIGGDFELLDSDLGKNLTKEVLYDDGLGNYKFKGTLNLTFLRQEEIFD
jgi:hypothetical protein